MMAIEPDTATAGPVESDGDALLQASRRVDLRFLLPDPDLGHVAYLGPARSEIAESLRLFSASVTIIQGLPAESLEACQYDVAVAIRPGYDELRYATSLVRETGYLYVEANGLKGPDWKGRLMGRWTGRKASRLLWPSDYTSFLASLGFDEVQAHWHWPNFECCTTMIPLADPAAVLHVLRRQQRGGRERMQAMVARGLVRAGIFNRLVSCFSVVARRVL